MESDHTALAYRDACQPAGSVGASMPHAQKINSESLYACSKVIHTHFLTDTVASAIIHSPMEHLIRD